MPREKMESSGAFLFAVFKQFLNLRMLNPLHLQIWHLPKFLAIAPKRGSYINPLVVFFFCGPGCPTYPKSPFLFWSQRYASFSCPFCPWPIISCPVRTSPVPSIFLLSAFSPKCPFLRIGHYHPPRKGPLQVL